MVKQQWKKRVEVFQYIYACLINDYSSAQINQQAFEKYDFDANQLSIIEYFSLHKKSMIELISKNLSQDWTWARLPEVDKAILMQSLAEIKTTILDRKIIIDQAIVSVKHFSTLESTKYVNAVLDKVIEKE